MIDRAAWIERLRAGDRCASLTQQPLSREFLQDTLDVVERYARIEKVVLGAVQVQYSSASLGVDLAPGGDPLQQGEALARAERERLQLPSGPVLELQRLVEKQGVKVLPCRFPLPAYAGGFFFDTEMGPCILLQRETNDSSWLYALAHQYAHFLADFDPYITTLCGLPGGATMGDPVEMRAHATALALLMPQSDLELYRDAMAGADSPLTVELVRHLQVYFDLDAEVVLWRLLQLGWIESEALRELLGGNEELANDLRGPVRDIPPGSVLLPERFVRLVASAFGSGRIDLEGAAAFFGVGSEEAELILGQFDYEAPAERKPEAKPKRGNGASRKA